MLLHGPLCHRTRSYNKEQNTCANIHLGYAYYGWEERFLTGPASRHDGENDPTEDLKEVVGE
jgi:hypothetical protein